MKHDIENMHLDGGRLCLDFINTVHSRAKPTIDDYLYSYADIMRWTKRTAILSNKQQHHLQAYADQHPAKAKQAFKKMIACREELYRLFRSLADGRRPEDEVVNSFNQFLPDALSHLRIMPQANVMQLVWTEGKDPLLLPLRMVIKSAYDVLINEPEERIKACPSCFWLFLDKTKNNKRRWCNSLACGSIDKATRYYYRKKSRESDQG